MEEIDELTNTQQSISLSDGSTDIPGSFSFADKTITFTPNTSLDEATTYTAIIRGDATDISGNKMGNDYTYHFETTKPPTVISTSPSYNSQNIGTNPVLRAVFSEAMFADTISTTSFTPL